MTFKLEGFIRFVTQNNHFLGSILFSYFAKTKKIVTLKQKKVFFQIMLNNKYTRYIFNALPICAFLNELSVYNVGFVL